MVAKLSEVGTHVTVGEQALVTRAKFKLADDLKATVEHRSASGSVAVTLAGKRWEVAHDFGKKDTRLKWKGKVGKNDLTLKQHVPDGKWALVPNPVVEVSRKGVLGSEGKLQASYDCLDRVGTLEQTVYGGDDKQHKGWVKLSSKKGPSAGLRSKLQAGPLLHSAAASYSHAGGWQLSAKRWAGAVVNQLKCELSAKSKFSDGTKVKYSYDVARDELKVAAKHTPAKLSDDAAEATLTLGMTIPVNKQQEPKVVFGIKFDM
ncbi:bifunctional sensory photoreceptor isoform B [Chlorella sorokiniana]|uniref:Bifunctional sensory photoreceptor isoform B n=1 Tax=Chlorella sorokiniana TaxID=3076 RepID=A0A2P6TCK6_CHLSO|nr:bifunctional sensory photoreceptor isoform B [Chlorella sorokiniana]|eukprot:PRW20384.1 bifunctional sensory photoreceptor isoform B [Chlorella sorokiniana]